MLLFLIFVPEYAAHLQAQTIIEELAKNTEYQGYELKFHGDLPVFIPHVTLMGLEGSNLIGVKNAMKQVLLDEREVILTVQGIRTTDYYFRSVIVFYDKNPIVTRLIGRLKEAFKEIPHLEIKSSNESYLHMSLIYTSATLDHKELIARAPLKSQSGRTLDEIYPQGNTMTVSKIILISTEEDESPAGVRNWTIQAEYPLK